MILHPKGNFQPISDSTVKNILLFSVENNVKIFDSFTFSAIQEGYAPHH